MSFFSGGKKDKDKDKDMLSKKSQFYVEFLGWMECRGVRGRKYTEPVIQELQRRQRKMDKPPKLTIQLTQKELKITQDFEEKKKRAIKKIKFPAIPARDVTYAVQAYRPDGRLDDIVACIYLGFMPRTQRYVHVHVYRFDEPSTAATFARLMNAIVETNANRINEVERELAERGEIEDPRLTSSDGMSEPHTGTDSAAGSASGSAYSEDESPTFGSDDMDADLQSLNDVQPFDSVAAELKHRLRMGDGPLLLPPKDYDTISRARGNLKEINDRRCLNLNVVGEGGPVTSGPGSDTRGRNGSEESGIDLTSPSSDTGDILNRFPPFQPASGNNSPGTPPVLENGFVYPPRQPAGGDRGYSRPPGSMSPALHVRQSSQSSAFSTHSSRASHHSDNSGDNAPIYRRSNNSSSNNLAAQFQPQPLPQPFNDSDLLPPADYHDDEEDDVLHEPVAMRPKALPLQPQRPHSGGLGSPGLGSPMLMRSLPANVLMQEMGRNSPRNSPLNSPRGPRGGGGGDEYFFNAQRRSQPVYASNSNVLDYRPNSAGDPNGVRRTHSMYR
nr:hypothetical protein BaRGS_030071 [Batillaria attramentaria]